MIDLGTTIEVGGKILGGVKQVPFQNRYQALVKDAGAIGGVACIAVTDTEGEARDAVLARLRSRMKVALDRHADRAAHCLTTGAAHVQTAANEARRSGNVALADQIEQVYETVLAVASVAASQKGAVR